MTENIRVLERIAISLIWGLPSLASHSGGCSDRCATSATDASYPTSLHDKQQFLLQRRQSLYGNLLYGRRKRSGHLKHRASSPSSDTRITIDRGSD